MVQRRRFNHRWLSRRRFGHVRVANPRLTVVEVAAEIRRNGIDRQCEQQSKQHLKASCGGGRRGIRRVPPRRLNEKLIELGHGGRFVNDQRDFATKIQTERRQRQAADDRAFAIDEHHLAVRFQVPEPLLSEDLDRDPLAPPLVQEIDEPGIGQLRVDDLNAYSRLMNQAP